jgi:hypothetical protein
MAAPRRWTFSRRTLVATAAVVFLAALCCREAASLLRASWSYQVTADFELMPDDDLELTAWLREQPGVVARTAVVERSGRTRLVVGFIQSRNLLGHPRFPDLDAKSKEIGYEGANSNFRDVPR